MLFILTEALHWHAITVVLSESWNRLLAFSSSSGSIYSIYSKTQTSGDSIYTHPLSQWQTEKKPSNI